METQERKKSPTLDLRGAEGNYVVGVFQGRFESKLFPGKYASLINVTETTGNTTIYNKEKKIAVEVDIDEGDSVFLSESTWLASFLEKRTKGDKIRIEYTGKGKAKKGMKAPFTYKTEVL